MAYVEWHDTVRNHPKTDALMIALDITRREAVGIIGCIVSWCILQRCSGYIEITLIKVAVEWEKDEAHLVRALVGPKEGQKPRLWLEDCGDGYAYILAWPEITKGFRKARKDAKRLKDKRRRDVKTSRDGSATVARPSHDSRGEQSGAELNRAERREEGAPPAGDKGGPDGTTDTTLMALARTCRIAGRRETLSDYLNSWSERVGKDQLAVILQNNRGKSVLEIQKLIEAGGNGADTEPPVRRIKPGEVIK